MAKRVKWWAGVLYTLAVIGALGFSARQAFAARKAADTCPCTMPLQVDNCADADCCNGPGLCTTAFDCICG